MPTPLPNGGMQNFEVEAVALYPHETVSNNVLAGILFRAAARRQLRLYVGDDGAQSFHQLAKVPELKVSYWSRKLKEKKSSITLIASLSTPTAFGQRGYSGNAIRTYNIQQHQSRAPVF